MATGIFAPRFEERRNTRHRRTEESLMRSIRSGLQAAGLALGVAVISVAAAPPAAAAPDVVRDCRHNRSDRCYFQPAELPWDAKGFWDKSQYSFPTSTYTGETENPKGTLAVNCSGSDGTYIFATAVTKTDTVSYTSTATVSGGLEGVFSASLSFAKGREYSTSHEERESFTVTLQPGYVGWITLTPRYERRTGYLWSNYPDRVDGHYAWAQMVTLEGYDGGTYHLNSAPASADQLSQCGVAGLAMRALGGGGPVLDRAVPDLLRDDALVQTQVLRETVLADGL
jgi:hypothetical protein